jgi:hypothetical protein
VVNLAVFVSSVVCEAVLCEKHSEVLSAIRIMDSLKITPAATFAHFFVLTFFHAGAAGEVSHHVAKVQMFGPLAESKSERIVAQAPDHSFAFKSKDQVAPPGYCLTTEFNVQLAELTQLGTYVIQVFLDGNLVAQSPLTLQH